jgi:hypothetical protein
MYRKDRAPKARGTTSFASAQLLPPTILCWRSRAMLILEAKCDSLTLTGSQTQYAVFRLRCAYRRSANR